MCGRMTLFDIDQMHTFLETQFNISTSLDVKPRYNISPKQKVVSIIYDGSQFRVGQITWGMMIHTKDKSYFNINAKQESLATFSYFKQLAKSKRMVIVLDGYYEWQDQGDYKTPFYMYPKEHTPMLAAALYDKIDNDFYTTLMTTTPIESIQSIHHRMPMLLSPKEAIDYLIKGTLPKTSSQDLTYHEVSSKVNLTKIDDMTLIQPFDSFFKD